MEYAGFLLVDKPTGWTSHDVVAKVRGVTGVKKVGHGGTLDPLATGLLIVGLGSATKQLDRFVQGDKEYMATVRLGATSDTDDAEGTVKERPISDPPDEDAVLQALRTFEGEQQQLPPTYSALKTAGKKHYELARAGKTVERKPRTVTVSELTMLEYRWPEVKFRVTVSKGTYIRSIARDLGEELGTGGYLAALRRERVGPYRVDGAQSIDEIGKEWQSRVINLDS